jgi:hypothetical protein
VQQKQQQLHKSNQYIMTKVPPVDDIGLYSGGGDGCSRCSPIAYFGIGVAILAGSMMLPFMIGCVVVLVKRCLCKSSDNHQHSSSLEEICALAEQELMPPTVESTEPTIASSSSSSSTTTTTTESSDEEDHKTKIIVNPLESSVAIQPQGLLPPRIIQVYATCLQTDIRPNILWKALYILDIDKDSENPGIWIISGRSTRSYDVNPNQEMNTVGQSYTIIGKVAQATGKAYWKELQNGTVLTALWKGSINFESSDFDGEYYYLARPPSTQIIVHKGTLKSKEHCKF